MAIPFQVTFDAAEPHRLARFWADALQYTVEDHSQLVDQLLAAGRLHAADVVEESGRRAFRDVAACADPQGNGPRLFFQRVPEGKVGKNRVHLDLHVGGERREAEVERLIGLGASRLWVTSDRGAPCVTLGDPEGNEFCVE
jgi:hypothetical protein